MPSILDLPNEIIDRILSFFGALDSDPVAKHQCSGSRELYNLCLVSQQFRNLAQPLVFRYFDGDDIVDFRPLILFARALYTRPALGEHVRFCTVTPLPYATPVPIAPDDLELFRKAVRDLNLDAKEEKDFIIAVETSDASVFLALAMLKTPNVRALRMARGHIFPEPLNMLFKRDSQYLSSLEQVWIACDAMYAEYEIGKYERFLTLPKMKGPAFEEGSLVMEDFPSSWTAGTLSCEEPAFEGCFIDAAALEAFSKACKKIKSFTYQGFDPEAEEEEDNRWAEIDSKEITAADAHAALLPHKATLEHFHLEFWRSPWAIDGIEPYADYCSKQTKLPSLRDFPVLEVVIVQHAFLPPHPEFPPSMEVLHITDCNSSIREMIGHIAKDVKKGLYPKLKDFRVLALDVSRPIKLPGQVIPPNQTPAQCFASLRDLFEGTKVDFQICPYDLDPGFDDEDDDEESFPQLSRGPIPPGLMQMLMQRAMADPEFAALVADGDGESDRSWVTDDDDA